MYPASYNTNRFEITPETLKQLLDYSSDEIFVFNRNQQVIYVNSACEKNYGLKKEDLLGKTSNELSEEKYWTPSIYPEVYKEKKPISLIQTTNTGAELLTSAIPILNDEQEVSLVITTARELQHYKIRSQQDTANFVPHHTANMVSQSEKLNKILTFSEKVAKSNSTILIQGESGTGKGVLANYIHQVSNRNNEAFLTINCAAIPEELLESELFGYSKGAFTGANPYGKKGLLETANNGTVLLDEIGDVSLPLQAKLLHVIQNKQFIPVGGKGAKTVNIRFIAATNRDLNQLIENGQFREDLYYRLNVIDITLPPLRDRREDIIPLAEDFLYKYNQEYETNKVITPKCLHVLQQYDWPGNIRQLENLIERLVIISDEVIDITDLPETFQYKQKRKIQLNAPETLDEAIEQAREFMIRKSFKKYNSTRKVAEDLKISQTTASRFIRKYCADLRTMNNSIADDANQKDTIT